MWRDMKDYLYLERIFVREQDMVRVKALFFKKRICKRCGKVVMPDCFSEKWRKKHKPFEFEREDYKDLLSKDEWNLWEVTKEELGMYD